MGTRPARRRILEVGLGVLLAVRAAAQEPAPQPLLRFVGSRSRSFETAVARAVDLAASRLAEGGCRAILLEFHDPSGRVLDDRLHEDGPGVRDYMASAEITERVVARYGK